MAAKREIKYKQLKIRMDEDVAEMFDKIKEKLKIKADVEVLRYLVGYYWEKEMEK